MGRVVGAASRDLPLRDLAIKCNANDWFSWRCPKTLQLVLNLEINHTASTRIMPSMRLGKLIEFMLKSRKPNWVLLYEFPIVMNAMNAVGRLLRD